MTGSYLPAVGFFVEVGAFLPVDFSQTWHLEQRGWDGILIEPIPQHAAALRHMRRATVFEIACGNPMQHGATLPISVAGGLSGFNRGGATVPVQLATLDSILSEAGATRIDFLSIDVEGAELDVLAGFSIERYRPPLILMEDFGDDLRRHRYLAARGYKRVRRTGNNSWYVPHEVPFPVTLFGRWQLLRKYYLSLPVRIAKRTAKKYFRTPFKAALRNPAVHPIRT